jgi:hypothetical protein
MPTEAEANWRWPKVECRIEICARMRFDGIPRSLGSVAVLRIEFARPEHSVCECCGKTTTRLTRTWRHTAPRGSEATGTATATDVAVDTEAEATISKA